MVVCWECTLWRRGVYSIMKPHLCSLLRREAHVNQLRHMPIHCRAAQDWLLLILTVTQQIHHWRYLSPCGLRAP